MRETGYCWVKTIDGWQIAKWDSKKYAWEVSFYNVLNFWADGMFFEIDENRIPDHE